MTDTKLDQIARAIYERRNGHGCKPWSKLTKSHQVPYLGDARAAVEAMREPTDHVLNAGIRAKDRLLKEREGRGENTRILLVSDHPAGTIYTAMIDSILTEGKQ